MQEFVVRPSMKLIRAAYTLVFAIVFACVFIYTNYASPQSSSPWLLLIPALLLLWPMKHHLQRRFIRLSLDGDKLRYEAGVLGRTRRIIQVAKVQDVRVDQTLMQRMLATGKISIETAGESGLLIMENIDDPDAVAEAILNAAKPCPNKPSSSQAKF